MKLELTPSETEVLAELLEAAHREMLHELHHTSTRAYAHLLRERIGQIEMLRQRLESHRLAPAH